MSIYIFYFSEFIGMILFYIVVIVENMSGVVMYELVSRNLSESKVLYNVSKLMLNYVNIYILKWIYLIKLFEYNICLYICVKREVRIFLL